MQFKVFASCHLFRVLETKALRLDSRGKCDVAYWHVQLHLILDVLRPTTVLVFLASRLSRSRHQREPTLPSKEPKHAL
jgi:hypothetical protein